MGDGEIGSHIYRVVLVDGQPAIFETLQGEGRWQGTPATFIRLGVCNLTCDFCDTEFDTWKGMTTDEIVSLISKPRHVVITGGEPTLQDLGPLIKALHSNSKYVSIETNGTRIIPESWEVDWICCSPKDRWFSAPIKIKRANEVKVVIAKDEPIPNQYKETIPADYYYVQPINHETEIDHDALKWVCDQAIKEEWQLCVQMHKLINIP
jgi:organic radical activating enzyme